MTQPSKTYHCTIEVRGYELDSYKHVNHANYLNYLEHARWKLLEEAGITLKELDSWQRWPVIAEVHARYLRPTYMGQRIDIETSCVEHGRTWFGIAQTMRVEGTEVFNARIRVVMVNEKGRPAEAPEGFKAVWGVTQ